MDYTIEVKDYKGLVVYKDSYADANTANHAKRLLEEQYNRDDFYVILHEPEDMIYYAI